MTQQTRQPPDPIATIASALAAPTSDATKPARPKKATPTGRVHRISTRQNSLDDASPADSDPTRGSPEQPKQRQVTDPERLALGAVVWPSSGKIRPVDLSNQEEVQRLLDRGWKRIR